jgi:hypothetical protein
MICILGEDREETKVIDHWNREDTEMLIVRAGGRNDADDK